MTRLKDLYEYLDYLDNCSDGQFLKFLDAMKKRGYEFVSQYVHDYDYPYVTHCKDCKYWDGDDGDTFCSELGIFGTDPNSFCSYAKRKEK
jgi:hypothetical protein